MCIRDDHRHCQELRPILEVTKNAKSSTVIVHIERDLEDIDAAFEKMKSDITNNISEITMCCLVDEDLAWCLLQSVHRKSSHSGHQVVANLDSLS
jgi:hypothetical protein